MNRTEWNTNMGRLLAYFPQREVSAETIAAYHDILGDMDGEVFTLAVRHCVETCDWFPTVRQLKRAADEIQAARIPDTYERMKAFPQLIRNPAVRAAVTTDLSDIVAELEAKRGSKRSLPAQNGRPVELFGDPRRRVSGE